MLEINELEDTINDRGNYEDEYNENACRKVKGSKRNNMIKLKQKKIRKPNISLSQTLDIKSNEGKIDDKKIKALKRMQDYEDSKDNVVIKYQEPKKRYKQRAKPKPLVNKELGYIAETRKTSEIQNCKSIEKRCESTGIPVVDAIMGNPPENESPEISYKQIDESYDETEKMYKENPMALQNKLQKAMKDFHKFVLNKKEKIDAIYKKQLIQWEEATKKYLENGQAQINNIKDYEKIEEIQNALKKEQKCKSKECTEIRNKYNELFPLVAILKQCANRVKIEYTEEYSIVESTKFKYSQSLPKSVSRSIRNRMLMLHCNLLMQRI